MMRISMPIDYGSFANATSLNLVARKLFFELATEMNNKKTFTIAATLLNDSAIGDVNQHYDCVDVPNMGGYRFPLDSVLNSKNLLVGIVGIDEVVLGREVYKTESDWIRNKPVISEEVKKWHQHVDKIKTIHVSNNSEKEQLEKFLNVPEEKLHVIPYGVDHEIFKPSSSKEITRKKILEKFLINESPYLIHISESNWARKNVFRLFEAFKKAKSLGLKHKLLIIGKNDPIVYEKAKHIHDIHMLGFVSESDLVNLIQGSDALINPSIHEGFGLPMLETMACGVSVITSNVFSPPEIVSNGGLFVNPYDVNDICKKIMEIATDQSLQSDLGKNGLKHSQDFSWKLTAKKLLDLMEKTTDKVDYDFNDSYDKAAKRTIVTLCQTNPHLKNIIHDLFKLDFSSFIDWIEENGYDNPEIHDYILPFDRWLKENKNSNLFRIN